MAESRKRTTTPPREPDPETGEETDNKVSTQTAGAVVPDHRRLNEPETEPDAKVGAAPGPGGYLTRCSVCGHRHEGAKHITSED